MTALQHLQTRTHNASRWSSEGSSAARAVRAGSCGGAQATRAPAARQERAISGSASWRAQIADVDAATLRHLREQVAGGFDEERFAGRIGFGNLKRCAARRRPLVHGWLSRLPWHRSCKSACMGDKDISSGSVNIMPSRSQTSARHILLEAWHAPSGRFLEGEPARLP